MPKQEEKPQPDSLRPFNPLSKEHLARSLMTAFLESPLDALPPIERFPGAGVYALYYSGDLPIYRELTKHNQDSDQATPIYVGKAVPSGSRKGGMDFDSAIGSALHRRLVKHADSIKQAENLDISHFQCRFLVVDDVWIPLAESLLIQRFRPLWNVVLDGFGNNAQGGGRGNQRISRWDVVHSGRKETRALQPSSKSKEELESLIRKSLHDGEKE